MIQQEHATRNSQSLRERTAKVLAARTLVQAARDAASTSRRGKSALYLWERRQITDWLDDGLHRPLCDILGISSKNVEATLRRLVAGEIELVIEEETEL